METGVRQGHAAKIIRDLLSKANEQQRPPDDRVKIGRIAGQYSWALYQDLLESTGKPSVSAEMEKRRGTPSEAAYFNELDAIKDFLGALGSLGTAADKS
jgi:hypothetical protein